MTQLTLHPGPRLLRVVYPDGALPQDEDVTDRAVEFLFDRLVLGPDVRLFESDTYSCRSHQQISLVHSRDLSLGDVLQAMLWEMTWFGLPDDTEEVLEEMAELGKPPEAWSEGMTLDEFTEHFHGNKYRHACQVLFESIGPFSAVEIDKALDKIPDSLNARQWLNKTLGKQVKLRPTFRRLSGRELRQAFDQASDEAPASARQASLQ